MPGSRQPIRNTGAPAGASLHQVPAHPDLIREVGRPRVAELHARALRVPEKRAKFDLPPLNPVPMDEILALIGPEAEEESGS